MAGGRTPRTERNRSPPAPSTRNLRTSAQHPHPGPVSAGREHARNHDPCEFAVHL